MYSQISSWNVYLFSGAQGSGCLHAALSALSWCGANSESLLVPPEGVKGGAPVFVEWGEDKMSSPCLRKSCHDGAAWPLLMARGCLHGSPFVSGGIPIY